MVTEKQMQMAKMKPVSTYVVSLRAAIGDSAMMQTTHDYLPYAESQADVWRRMYPTSVVTIDVVN